MSYVCRTGRLVSWKLSSGVVFPGVKYSLILNIQLFEVKTNFD